MSTSNLRIYFPFDKLIPYNKAEANPLTFFLTYNFILLFLKEFTIEIVLSFELSSIIIISFTTLYLSSFFIVFPIFFSSLY